MLTHSDQINEVAAALAAAQLVMDNAHKESVNPGFKSRYADLASVRDAVNLPLAQAKIACVQAPSVEGKQVRVETRFVHASGQWFACVVGAEAKAADAQSIGSAITYLRRYGLMALAGIAPDDDDGNAASHAPRWQEPREERRPEPVRPPPASEKKWTDPERKAFMGELAKVDADYNVVASWCENLGKPRPSAMDGAGRSALLAALIGPARERFNTYASTFRSEK